MQSSHSMVFTSEKAHNFNWHFEQENPLKTFHFKGFHFVWDPAHSSGERIVESLQTLAGAQRNPLKK